MFTRNSMMRSFLSCVAFVAAAAAGSAAFGQNYSNTAAITIPTVGTAAPYPSTITVAGGPASIGSLIVTLRGFSHTFPQDVQVLLVAPSGQAIVLMNSNGSAAEAVGLTLEFSSTTILGLPAPLVSGTYAASGGNVFFFPPAPLAPFLSGLAQLAGGNSNGVWKLFVSDRSNSNGGAIAQGWSLDFPDPATPIAPTTFTYQGKLTGGAGNGTIDTRFTVFDALTGSNRGNRVGAVSTATGIALVDGGFTAPVNPGVTLPVDRKTWLEVEVANPSGSAFVALTPRQPITPTPLASATLTLDYSSGLLLGLSGVVGTQHAPSNRGGKSRFGYALNVSGLTEFVGMQPIVAPGTGGCGNSGDLAFFTWECSISGSREIMRINGSGNVGIGTTAPLAKLDVRGSIALGDGTLRAASGTEDLRLLRGTVDGGGGVVNGSGFTSNQPSVGRYNVVFATPFSSVPSITAIAFNSGSVLTVSISTVTTTGAALIVHNSAGAPTNSPFAFTVMGPR